MLRQSAREIIEQNLTIQWGTGDLRPRGITDDFCQLLKKSGCNYVNLSIESGSDVMLKRLKRDILLTRSGNP